MELLVRREQFQKAHEKLTVDRRQLLADTKDARANLDRLATVLHLIRKFGKPRPSNFDALVSQCGLGDVPQSELHETVKDRLRVLSVPVRGVYYEMREIGRVSGKLGKLIHRASRSGGFRENWVVKPGDYVAKSKVRVVAAKPKSDRRQRQAH